jgi:hypothetical protein
MLLPMRASMMVLDGWAVASADFRRLLPQVRSNIEGVPSPIPTGQSRCLRQGTIQCAPRRVAFRPAWWRSSTNAGRRLVCSTPLRLRQYLVHDLINAKA